MVEERMKEYYESTEPVIEIFRDAGVLIDIDGSTGSGKLSPADVRKALNLA